jgi:hypothetical protein
MQIGQYGLPLTLHEGRPCRRLNVGGPHFLLRCPNLEANKLLFSSALFVTLQLFQAKSAVGFCYLGSGFLSGYCFRFLPLTFTFKPPLFFTLLTFPAIQLFF